MRRKEEYPATNRSRRQFTNVTDVRHEVFRVYWDVKEGNTDPKVGKVLLSALNLGAKMMMESEQEQAIREMREELDALLAEIEALGATRFLPADLLARVRPGSAA